MEAWLSGLKSVLYFDLLPGSGFFPFIILWILIASLYFAFRTGFIGVRLLHHAWRLLTNRYSESTRDGSKNSIAVLMLSLSASSGVIGIVGTAIAVSVGGAGALFWMMVAGFFFLHVSYVENALGHQTRVQEDKASVHGGAMHYLSRGFALKGLHAPGQILAILYAVLSVLVALVLGNVFQVNQSYLLIQSLWPDLQFSPWILGVVLAVAFGFIVVKSNRFLVGLVTSVSSIALLIYLLMCALVIGFYLDQLPIVLTRMFSEAFSVTALSGGVIIALVQGIQQAVVSSHVSTGLSAMQYSDMQTRYASRAGAVSIYQVIISIFVVGLLTGLVVLLSGIGNLSEMASAVSHKQGSVLLMWAFYSVSPWLYYLFVIVFIVLLMSGLVAWYLYAKQSFGYLFGASAANMFKVVFALVLIGATFIPFINSQIVYDWGVGLLLLLTIPNVIGLYVLYGYVQDETQYYVRRLVSGELDREV